jgi:hypothetical protein
MALVVCDIASRTGYPEAARLLVELRNYKLFSERARTAQRQPIAASVVLIKIFHGASSRGRHRGMRVNTRVEAL